MSGKQEMREKPYHDARYALVFWARSVSLLGPYPPAWPRSLHPRDVSEWVDGFARRGVVNNTLKALRDLRLGETDKAREVLERAKKNVESYFRRDGYDVQARLKQSPMWQMLDSGLNGLSENQLPK